MNRVRDVLALMVYYLDKQLAYATLLPCKSYWYAEYEIIKYEYKGNYKSVT